MAEDPGVTAADPAPGPLRVTVLRSGGIAGMVRRWSVEIPDDDSPPAQAARRIAGRGHERTTRGRLRDGFQWTVTCGEGSLLCDEAGRRGDPEVDALIDVVTRRAWPG